MGKVEERELIGTPKEYTSKEDLFALLSNGVKEYLSNDDLPILKKAYETADKLHEGQKRRSGEEYIIHPLCVAIILANLRMDIDTIVAAILHDTVEDTNYTIEEVKKDFSEHVALLVDGVTKLTKLNLVNDKVERQAENLRHMFLSMSKDIRVIIIKLADRLHNLRTLEYQTREKQEEKSLETLEIYSPIANRLGISKIKTNMDDLSLRYLKPKEYHELVKSIKLRKETREALINELIKEVEERLKNAQIEAEVYGRVKNLFSIYKKIINKHKTIDQIYDLFAIRILVKDVKDCYATLGIIHEYYKPIPGRFKDYIAMPKQNNYQSLHTTVLSKKGIPFEIQIRTYDMHRVAEYGVAAHWAYKENGNSSGVKNIAELEEMNWLKDILNAETENSKEFLNYVKDDFDLLKSKVYCFTPEGDVVTLPQDATPVDFAYMIHSAVGNKMIGAKVNGVLVPIDYKIKNGDQINILTSGNSQGPSRDWLKIVKSPQAKNKIQHWFKKERREENISIGRDIFEKYCKSKKYNLDDLLKPEYIKEALKKYTCQELDDLYAMIGHGGLKESQLASKLKEEYDKANVKEITDNDILASISSNDKAKIKNTSIGGVQVKGIEDLAVHYAKCCSPVPGDEIIGYVTRGRGITVHRTDCINIINLPENEKGRLFDVTWQNESENKSYYVTINVFVNNRKGILADISKTLTENNIEIRSIESRVSKDEKGTLIIGFETKSKEELNKIITKIRSIENVIDIERG